jgi:hypothetical protein
MSETTGIRKHKWARWSAAAAVAGIAVFAAAGPAAAETQVGVQVTAAVSAAGQVTLTGLYTCDPAVTPYAELSVSGTETNIAGVVVQATAYDRVACTGTLQRWQETLTAPQAATWFSDGSILADVNVWTPGDWNGRSEAAQWVWVS